MEQKHVGKFLYFNIFHVVALNATGYTNSLTWQIYKKIPIEIQDIAGMFLEIEALQEQLHLIPD